MNKYHGEFIKASTPLGSGKHPATLSLTDSYLIHKKKSGVTLHVIATVEKVVLHSKILILPTVTGGIAAPLFLVAGFNGIGNIWAMLFLAFMGVFALYFGLSGTQTLTIKFKNQAKEYDIFLFTQSDYLPDFLLLLNHILYSGRSLKDLFLIELSPEESKKLKKGEELKVPESGRRLFFNHGEQKATRFKLDDPIGRGLKINFQKKEGALQPYLFSNIPPDMVSLH